MEEETEVREVTRLVPTEEGALLFPVLNQTERVVVSGSREQLQAAEGGKGWGQRLEAHVQRVRQLAKSGLT